MQYKRYNLIYSTITQNTQVVIQELCNSWTVINTGTTVATVNGLALNPGTPGTSTGESYSIGGNFGELFYGRIDVGFATGIGSLMVIQKIYLE